MHRAAQQTLAVGLCALTFLFAPVAQAAGAARAPEVVRLSALPQTKPKLLHEW